ncbi:MAG TPA: PIN domain-containing protein, partial [Desulfatiglandales bacterium]|nr:PIN domain-containing protein [Desulfatiglandales bacterium]
MSGFFIARGYYGFPESLIGLLFGFLVSIIVIQIEQVIRKVSIRSIAGGVVGTIIGLSIASLIAYSLRFWANQEVVTWIYVALTCILGYLGLVIGSKKSEEISLPAFGPFKKGLKNSTDYRILDTSVIIDGRVADICDTGFIEGDLIVPQFILDELQHIADSSDSMKRSRGRRGLDVLNRMQKCVNINIEVVDQDFPKIKEVDSKLVALAKKMNGKLITNDFNLNKIAELQGIKILNVNELANALKPVVLPGEVVSVKIIKEGKEPGQGVAYLDDGTMVVV